MAETKPSLSSPFTGRWRIVSMSAWEQSFIDEEEEGYIEFGDKDRGQFHFGYVHGQMDCRLTTRDGEPAVEWTWDGNDEMDPAQGAGRAVLHSPCSPYSCLYTTSSSSVSLCRAVPTTVYSLPL